ncbi:phosphoenolpyruvate--protein phosphotransferase [Pelovirga terrestris]|uniref:phosphoenolpyruvate--protein phosphotransferase n=1 Tax=Pelovirga terrestris TaxID=2771352 RepID=A0A8J6UHK8_9BACT|nr:phosphoenolpyruvate--protein phosphotransferase [Pelovirga terrestris]MBD1399465.1 phosphoenolpyruvate--protein phosphotransferase [Pelovirga terrestris]
MARIKKKSDLKLGLHTLQDISALILRSHDLDETINNIVHLVADRARSEVCSLYLLDDDQHTLVLRASHGLTPESIGKVKLQIGEGLTGKVAAEQQVLAISHPQNHPDYRFFHETGEEQFHTFVGIPLQDRSASVGVLVIQTRDIHHFSADELATLTTIAFQVASIVVNARLLDTLHRYETPGPPLPASAAAESGHTAEPQTIALYGKMAYPGIITGPVTILDHDYGFADIFDECNIDVEAELTRLDDALRHTRIQTLYLEKRVASQLSQEDAAIFHTHLMILEDRGLIERLHHLIEERHSAPYALKKVINGYLAAFARMEDPYLRERAADMEDVGRRLLANLVGRAPAGLQLQQPSILVAKRLLPSDMAILDHEKILGIVLESNEANSHSVIMAKGLGIPTVIGVEGVTTQISPNDYLILDANAGCLYPNPSASIIAEYQRLEQNRLEEKERLSLLRDVIATTRDGRQVFLRANIGLISDVDVAIRHGAQGVGLYRTEFLYMTHSGFPDRDQQYQLYKQVVEKFAGMPVTIRTLDIGGDKSLPYFRQPQENNPFMGWRSIRISLDYPDIFQVQLEAILMAATAGPLRLLFPMISNLNEIRSCKELIRQAAQQLEQEGIPYQEHIKIGAMIEIPAAIHLAPHLAKEVDFFALGTNDLIQYLLAADRSNPRVQNHYDPLHPAVLQSIDRLVSVARSEGTELCLCGEMATDPACLLALIGLGIRDFSLSAPYIPQLKNIINQLDSSAAEAIMRQALELGDSSDIRHLLDSHLEY